MLMINFPLLTTRILILVICSLLFTLTLKAQQNAIGSDTTSVLDKSSYYAIDTTVYGDLVKSLRGFLKAKNAGSLYNPYIHPDYLKEDAEPFNTS